jgi:N-acetylneuraminic acid mutarotase
MLGDELLAVGQWEPVITAYDTVTNSWSEHASLASWTSARIGHGIITVDGKVYMIGGEDELRLKDLQILSVAEKMWVPLTSMPHQVREFATAAWDNCIYVFGGMRREKASRKVLKYDIGSNAWSVVKPMRRLTSGARAAATLSGLIYVTGGHQMVRGDEVYSDDLDCYDPIADKWIQLASMTSARSMHESFVFYGSVYVIGGCERMPGLPVEDDVSKIEMERYDIATNEWSAVNLGAGVERPRPVRCDFGSLLIDVDMNLFDVCEYGRE